MIADEFRNFVRKKPFRPYRITLTDGRTFDLLHPEAAVVGFGSITLVLTQKHGKASGFDNNILISLLHVMEVDFLDSKESSDPKPTNGKS